MSTDEPNPQTDPEGAVDALEERTLGERQPPPGRPDHRDDDDAEPAFDVDLDPEDQGRADTGAEQSG